MIANLLALVQNQRSRLSLFMWEWEAYGKGEYWYHGQGVWAHTHSKVDEIMRSQQDRGCAFGAMNAPVPDLFATDILIFLSNSGADSQWAAIRKVLHKHFLDGAGADYQQRMGALSSKIAEDWPKPTTNDLNDTALLQRMV